MKHTTHVALFLLMLCTQHTTFSMHNDYKKIELKDNWFDDDDIKLEKCEIPDKQTDSQPSPKTTLNKNPDRSIIVKELNSNLIALLNTNIDLAVSELTNKSIINYLTTSSPTEEEISFTTINSIYQYSDFLEQNLIKELYNKNKPFVEAITYFTRLARKNLDNVTINTLELVHDATALQPIAQLNKLPAAIKKYVMNYAYDSIKHPYDITLTGHTRNINVFDIHVNTHRAVTSSFDETLRLWDLTTGKLIYTFPETNNGANSITFNNDGSNIATARDYQNSGIIINIWDILLQKIIRTATIANEFGTIKHFNYVAENILFACNEAQKFPKIATITFNKKTKQPRVTITTLPLQISPIDYAQVSWNKIYSTKNPYKIDNLEKTLTITKLNCRDLYLCQQAVKNSPSSTAKLIKNSPVFQKLTEFEQNIICTSFSPKLQQLTNK